MKNRIAAIPAALQHIIFKRMCETLLAIAAAGCLFIQSGSIFAAAPFLLVAITLAATAIYTGWLATNGHYLALDCVVLQNERTVLRGRPKALLIVTQGVVLRLSLRGNMKMLETGVSITVYVSDATPLFDWRGIHQLSSYLTVAMTQHQRQNREPL